MLCGLLVGRVLLLLTIFVVAPLYEYGQAPTTPVSGLPVTIDPTAALVLAVLGGGWKRLGALLATLVKLEGDVARLDTEVRELRKEITPPPGDV